MIYATRLGIRHEAVDRMGTLASTACATHCFLSAVLPGLVAGLGLGALLDHEAEWGFTIAAIAFASLALGVGWRKHRSGLIASALGLGIALLLLARVVEEGGSHMMGTAIGILAGLVLVVGHVSGVRASRRARPREL